MIVETGTVGFTGTAMEEIVCPLESRPSVFAIFAKLLFSHIINLAALVHLTYIRGESLPVFQSFVFVTAPLSIAFRQGITVLYILITVFRPEIADAEAYVEQHLALLLFTNVQLGTNRRRTLFSPSSLSWSKSRQSRNKHIRQVSFTLIFVFKCLAGMLLYQRRRANSAATLADDKMFELACGGLSVGLLTLFFIFEWPWSWFCFSGPSNKMVVLHKVKDPMSSANKESTFTSIDVVLAVGRDIWIPSGYVYRDENSWLIWQIYHSGTISFATQMLVKLFRGFTCAIFFGLVLTYGCPPLSEVYNTWFWLSLVLGMPIGLLISCLLSYTTPQHLAMYGVWTAMIAILLPLWMPLLFGYVFGPLILYQDYSNILSNQRIERLAYEQALSSAVE